ncbi:MAG TPA: hypothetical protein ENN22_10365 [bacterium]|nr:hypothetical protein [bacterium]HDP99567.1 hypothetical protein [bacterium]
MDCVKTLQQICDELCEDIDKPLCTELKEHLKHCPKCCAEVDSIRKVVYLYRHFEDKDVPDSVNQRLWKVLNLQCPD